MGTRSSISCLMLLLSINWASLAILEPYQSERGGYKPRITEFPQSKELVEYDEVSLRCEASGDPPPVIRWKINNRRIRNVEGTAYNITNKHNQSVLKITTFRHQRDEATFTCVAVNVHGKDQAQATLQLYDPSKRKDPRPKIIRAPKSHKVVEGRKVRFACLASGNPAPTLYWEKNNENIINGTFVYYVIFMKQNQSVLVIDPVKAQRDNATFTCIANNVHGEARANATLQVYGQKEVPNGYPFAELNIRKSFVEEGFDVTNFCLVRGIPIPVVTWFEDGFPVDMSNQRYDIRGRGSEYFRIHETVETDSHTFDCVAENEVGITYVPWDLQVFAHPYRPIIRKPPQDQFVRIGHTAKFSCTSTTRAIFSWFRHMEPKAQASSREKMTSNFRVVDVGLKDNNTYVECQAKNEYGVTWASAWIRVVDEAVPQGPPEDFRYAGNNEMGITLSWRPPAQSNGDIVMYEISYHNMSDPSEVQSLNVTDTRVTIPGLEIKTNYCSAVRAFNSKGAGPWSSKLHFPDSGEQSEKEKYLPKITQAPKSHKAAEGYKVSFTCEGSGILSQTFHWEKNNKKIERNNRNRYRITEKQSLSVLTIDQVIFQRDNATFTCVAKNHFGETRANATLQVYENFNGEEDVPLGYPWITVHPKQKTVYPEGTMPSLLCRAEGISKPKITWMKDNLPLNMTHSRFKIQATGSLIIKDARVSDTGMYECVAENEVGVVYSYAANLHVKGRPVPPHFTVRPKNITVRLGSDVNLKCIADGSPKPFVKWRDGIYELKKEAGKSLGRNVLKLKNVTESKQYTCIASSVIGSIETTADVIVKFSSHKAPGRITFYTHAGVVNSTSILLSWDEPGVSFRIIQGYKVFCTLQPEENVFSWRVLEVFNNTKATISNLEPNQTYTISIMVYSGHKRAMSQLIHVKTLPSASGGSPQNVCARSDGSSITVSWNEPDITNGNIQGYRILYTLKPETSTDYWSVQDIGANALSGSLRNLIQDQTYTIRVLAYSATGKGPLSDPVEVTTRKQGLIGSRVESLLAHVVSANEIDITWTVSEGSDSLVSYRLSYDDTYLRKYVHVEFNSSGKTYRLSNLRPDTLYNVQLSTMCRNEEYSSQSIAAKTHQFVPGMPREVEIEKVNSKSIVVKWRPPSDTDQRGIIRGYEVYVYEADKYYEPIPSKRPRLYDTFNGIKREVMISDLSPFKRYVLSVGAYTGKGGGVRSKPEAIPVTNDP